MNVKDIIKKYLTDNKYDGLFCDDGCSCKNLEHTDICSMNCKPGYLKDCTKCNCFDKDLCNKGYDFCIIGDKD